MNISAKLVSKDILNWIKQLKNNIENLRRRKIENGKVSAYENKVVITEFQLKLKTTRKWALFLYSTLFCSNI